MKKLFYILLVGWLCALAPSAHAADVTIGDLSADASPTTDDLIETENDPGGTPGSRKVTIENLFGLHDDDTRTMTNKTIDGDDNTVQDLPYSSIKSTSRSGSDATVITGTAGSNTHCAQWNADGDLVTSGAACTPAETNSLETTITGIADTEIFVGDGADSGAFVAMSGDVTMANTGATTIQANAVALETDTTGDFVGTITGGDGVSSTGATSGESIDHTLSVAIKTSEEDAVGTTASASGLEFESGELTLLQGCSDNQILKWDETDDDWNCEADTGGGTGAFDDSSDPVVLNTTTKDVVVGAAQINSGKLSVDGDADQVQFAIQGHSSQTANILEIENSGGSVIVSIDNSGNVTISGTFGGLSAGVYTLDSLNEDQIEDIYILNSGDSGSGNYDFGGATSFEIPNTVVGSLPTATAGRLALITDGNADNDCTTGGGSTPVLCMANGSTWEPTGDSGPSASGDNVSVDSGATTDPDFVSTGDIDFVNTSNTITANINAGAIVDADVNASAAIAYSKLSLTNSVVENDLVSSLAFDDGDLIDLSAVSITTTSEGLILPQHATDCSTVPTAEGQVCWEADADTLYIGNGTTVTQISSGSGAFSDASDPVVLNTTTKDVHVGDGAGTLVGKLEIGGDADQPQLVIEGHSTQTDDILIIQQDDDTEVFSVGNDGTIQTRSVDTASVADTDFGDFTCSSGVCTLDADTVAAAEMADADHGDVSWSSGVATVDNVSAGAYAAASVDGDDVNSNIAGRSLTLTAGSPDTLDVDAEIYTRSKGFVLESPSDADAFLFWKAETALTITDIHCITSGGTSAVIDIQECSSTGASCTTVDATITCDSDGAEDDGSLTNGTIDLNDWVNLDVGTVTGTVTYVTVEAIYTVDD